MKKILLFPALLLLIYSCSTGQSITYRPLNSNEKLWDIRIEQGTVSGQFEVIINDELVIEETPNMFTDTIDEKAIYQNRVVRLIVNFTNGFLGIGEGYNVSLLIDNELAAQVTF